MKKTLIKLGRMIGLVIVGSLALLTGCQGKFIYFPRPYAAGEIESWQKKTRGEIISYTTEHGKQQAYLQRQVRQQGPPNRLWIVGAGNGSLALDMADWIWDHGDPRDAYILIDYPGYGPCESSPNPSRINANVLAAVPAAVEKLGLTMDAVRPKLRIFAHSLGCAAMLSGAKELGIHRGILIAPFTSTMEMSKKVIGVNLGFLVYHRFDNVARLGEVVTPDAKFIIFHGSEDEVIPVEMSREMKAKFPAMIDYHEIPEGQHNDLLLLSRKDIATAIKALD